ncbi:MAG: prephenate dehydrogenase/arogenate dehydrogenase family protein [Oceanospirillaceae bacterium]
MDVNNFVPHKLPIQSTEKPANKLTIGLIGYGSFGAFLHQLAQRFVADAQVKVFSDQHTLDNQTFFALDEVINCDLVVLAVPIRAYRDVLTAIIPKMRAQSVLVDVATVKDHTMQVIKSLSPACAYISLHPMFGPESYRKRGGDLSDLCVVMTGHTLSQPQYSLFSHFIEHTGLRLVEKTAQEHDQELAETLFLTHFIGQIISKGNFKRTEIDTLSFAYLMDSVDSVKHDDQLFKDVCRFNPYCLEVMQRFDESDRFVRNTMLELEGTDAVK